ncbi:3-isopropylmalate dehydratase small subunit [Stutzerimonas azotifigens]|uniref:3-isopropylmalate dehydratase small subunit n=1 Tax=Stutzerimonas azotifigens TaxID=291995 RepID=A0ABR5Z624_9GAMM|nr:3-isopropylmalate dehydratase small subunit [Stutzerimonas azotifigens]MBA1275668.1 3-isopropylmalate dehydratase small subunit [Stutzerimonas azotifigens]
MQPFTTLDGLVVPLDRRDVDTDAIMPKQFMKSIRRTGFGQNLFDSWRYLDEGVPGADCSNRPLNPEFSLNQPRYQGAQILLCRDNFGCGSSREHAVWGIEEFGFRVLLGTSFADIFFNNCLKNGVLPIRLAPEVIDSLFVQVEQTPGLRLQVDLPQQQVRCGEQQWRFDIDGHRKHCLIEGLDDIDLTLARTDEIERYEQQRQRRTPWLFEPVEGL